ncbi:MAG: thioredoxin family protein [Bacteroidia bacterium]|nr:thioredoxin family protein [Bacteroidia bacterium]
MVCDDGRCLPPETIEFEFKVKGSASCVAGKTVPEDPNKTIPGDDPKNEDTNPAPDTSSTVEGFKPVAVSFFPKKNGAKEYELVVRLEPDSLWSVQPEEVHLELENAGAFTLNGGLTLLPSKDNATGKLTFTQKLTWTGSDTVTPGKLSVSLNFKATGTDPANGKPVTLVLKEKLSTKADMSKATKDGRAAEEASYWVIFFTAFFSGFLALLTPCVFPMIPMTVSFFLKTSKSKAKGIKNAILYGIFIIVIYVTLGLSISAIFGSDALNALSTNVYFNIFFFLLLVVFAASFLGAFEIVLPSKWVNAADKGSERGGIIGIFFMAATLGLVSFSCTGPIIGTLLVQASQQGGLGPFFGMFGFSLAIALPFSLFAIFPGWLNSMPKSGGWLNSVKVSLGFLELALAFKFLSNADLVVQAHLLEREIFLSLWIVIFFLWGMYLLGKLKLSHDSDMPYLSVGRLSLAIGVFSFVAYMVPGLWGAPLKIIAAFPPPQYYSESPYGVGGEAPADTIKLPEHAVFGPHKLITFHDYHQALEYARSAGKPVMIDFTGYACVNCRLMEENVWSSPNVLNLLRKEVVIASLHVDDKTLLPESERYLSAFDGKKIRTVGNKWSDLQKSNYGSNSQPQYMILDHQENTMNGVASYESHGQTEKFLPWLEEGLKLFAERKESPVYRPLMVKAPD